MRNILFIIIIFISISCQRNDTEYVDPELLYSVDTVIIDSKGRSLDLDRYILISDINENEESLFLYSGFDYSIDEINLQKLEIVSNYPFEAEGPNGIGMYVNSITVLNDSLFFIKSFNSSTIIDKKGILKKRIEWLNLGNSESEDLNYESPKMEIATMNDNLKIFGLSFNEKRREVFLDVLPENEKLVNRYEIDPNKSYSNFILEIDDPQSRTFMDPHVFLMSENNLIIISHQYSNELLLFDPTKKSVQAVYYSPETTPKRVKDLENKIFTSFEVLREEYQHFLEQIRFGPPVWDRLEKRYLRLSAKRIFSESKIEEGSLLPDVLEVKVYLSVLDSDFNLVSEVHIPELRNDFIKYFAKDGKLWVSQNFSDELGFIIIDI